MGLLFGVMIFAVIMGKYSDIIEKIKTFQDDADESDGLSKFFSILSRYNNYKPYPEKLRSKFDAYFEHRWETHKNALL